MIHRLEPLLRRGTWSTRRLASHTATLLDTGKVLITGGEIVGGYYPGSITEFYLAADPELYDPVTGVFSPAGEYAKTGPQGPFDCGDSGMIGVAALLLPNQKVLIAGQPSTNLYDPLTSTFSLAGTMTIRGGLIPCYIAGRSGTLLATGDVLLAGGEQEDLGNFADAELYDPSTGTFTAIQNMTRVRSGHTATLLRDGTVLIAGGDQTCYPQNSGGVDVLRCDADDIGTEIYDPSTSTFNAGANMTSYRISHTATLLMDGRILITGGDTDMRNFWPTNSAEFYTPSLLIPAQVVTELRFDRMNAVAGSSYSANVSGSNLTSETFFDVRFTSPGSNASAVVLNWQRGLTERHDVPAGLAAGAWTINGVRAHQIETDHTGNFFPVSATITVVQFP